MNHLRLIGFRHDGEDLTEFFQKNCVVQQPAHYHFPFVVFTVKDYETEVRIVREVSELLHCDDNAVVIKQWPGKMRSDYFKFSVGQLREFLKEHPREMYPKGEWQV